MSPNLDPQEQAAVWMRRARAKVPFELAEHLVVIGCGPVAARLVEDLLPWARNGHLRVTVIGAETHMAYNRVLVGEYAMGRVPRELLQLSEHQRWTAAGVRVRLGARVVGLDRTRRTVRLTGEPGGPAEALEILEWDRLVLATGARPVRPNIRGLDPSPDGATLPSGVLTLRDLHDADHVRPVVASGGHVVVLGGGVLGVEAALAAAETAGASTLVHTGQNPMERVLDSGTAKMLGQRMASAGVTCISGRAVGVTLGEDHTFQALEVAQVGPVAGDLLVLSCGVQARTDLAESAGLRVRHGIVVDHELQADVEGRVFAMGDCAEVACRDAACEPCALRAAGHLPPGPAGLIAPGWRQAEYLAARISAELNALLEGASVVQPVEPLPAHEPSVLRLKAHDLDLVVLEAGIRVPSEPARTIQFTDTAMDQDLRVELEEDGHLRRAVAMGRPRAVAHLTETLGSRSALRGDLTYLMALDSSWAAPEPTKAGPDTVVCRCAGVTRGAITAAMDDGASDVAQVRTATRACSGCGTCTREVQELLDSRVAH
ncbi:FAD-dependent oxidoreductase [Kocuria sp.]|uniref:FAD-dependent oxidoreductase n=1 Tax=Kocuria sp. TaxID=1871328 RepID=UPI0026DECBE0|nr:FAD-dependent oxidoreductase [Kocuria sp.]MDO5619097.1 FAD-dependent oxidoreductase [Kocuria sp.]